MCGIAGIINFNLKKVQESDVAKMIHSIRHRGPDDWGIFTKENIGLGHRRLSILDLSELGKQPMVFDDIYISFNGEIFNFQEIRQELINKNYQFISNSDTEVILKAYNEWGIEFIHRLNGMFAICIFDNKINKLYLIRDRLGIKPIFYFYGSEHFTFASELKAIKESSSYSFTINSKSIQDFLHYLYIPSPKTMFNEINKVKPGNYLEIDIKSQSITEVQYWDLEVAENECTIEQDINAIEELLIDSISKRLISDVPVGAFLSGGVDSSLICTMAHTVLGKKLDTFSIGYEDEGSFFDETIYAESVAKKIGSRHTTFKVNFNVVFDDFDEIMYYMDEPNADTSVFLNYYISKLTRQSVTVALSGLGGDELFGGYNRYQAFLLGNKYKYLPKLLVNGGISLLSLFPESRTSRMSNMFRSATKLAKSIDKDPNKFYYNLINYWPHSNGHISNCENISANLGVNHILKFDVKTYMVDDLLELTDRMSMAHALEVRTPFLDYRLVNRAFQIHPERKVNNFEKKIILKKLAEKYLDKNIIYRRKQGFSAPVELWLKKYSLSSMKQKLINERMLEYLPSKYIEETIDMFYIKNKDSALQLYALYVLDTWLKKLEK